MKKLLILLLINIGLILHAVASLNNPTTDLTLLVQDKEVIRTLKNSGKILSLRRISNGKFEGYQIKAENCQVEALISSNPTGDTNWAWPWDESVHIISSSCK